MAITSQRPAITHFPISRRESGRVPKHIGFWRIIASVTLRGSFCRTSPPSFPNSPEKMRYPGREMAITDKTPHGKVRPNPQKDMAHALPKQLNLHCKNASVQNISPLTVTHRAMVFGGHPQQGDGYTATECASKTPKRKKGGIESHNQPQQSPHQ